MPDDIDIDLDIDGRHERNLSASEQVDDPDYVARDDQPPKRVQADLADRIGVWKGVRSCAETGRATDQLLGEFHEWIGEIVVAHPGKRVWRWRIEPSRYWYENRTRNGKRSCKGGFVHARAWIDLVD